MKSERPLSLGRGFFHALRRCKRSARPVLARLAESHQVGWKILRPDSESDAEGIAKLPLRERLDAAVFMKDDRSTGWFDGAEKASQETFRWKAIINRDDYFNPSIGAGLVC